MVVGDGAGVVATSDDGLVSAVTVAPIKLGFGGGFGGIHCRSAKRRSIGSGRRRRGGLTTEAVSDHSRTRGVRPEIAHDPLHIRAV
jgi:hypothetical protein